LGRATGRESFPRALNDFALFDSVTKPEFEANLFAAELLISDEALIQRLNNDLSFFGVLVLYMSLLSYWILSFVF